MAYLGYLKFIFQHTPFLAVQNLRLQVEDCIFAMLGSQVYYMALFLRYSYFFKQCTLVDIGGYDLPVASAPGTRSDLGCAALGYTPTLWYIFKDQGGARIFIFSLQLKRGLTSSIEALFRNARWLEREATDFFGFFFSGKSDRRSLFTLPLFYNAPFRRKYPAVGFYELFFCPILKKLKFKHLSLQV
jgi:NADH:ubiquinone oxidoreductase subunit C